MTWVKLDDRFPDHPKVLALGDDYERGLALHVRGLCYAAGNLTDGFVPARAFREDVAIAARLVAVGLWKEVAGGYLIHDFLDFNKSKAQVEKEREEWRARQVKSRTMSRRDTDRDSRSESHPDSSSPVPVPVPVPVPPHNPTPQTPQAVGGWDERMTSKQLEDLAKTFGMEKVTATAEQLEAEEIAGTVQVRNFASLLAHRLKNPKPTPSAPDAYTAADYMEGTF